MRAVREGAAVILVIASFFLPTASWARLSGARRTQAVRRERKMRPDFMAGVC
jgi:hypothetical protein